MKAILCIFLALTAATAAVAADVPNLPVTDATIPVAALAGTTPAVMTGELGKAVSCEASKYGQRCFYKDGAVEVMFIGGVADWFTVYPKDAFLTPASLKQLALPTDSNPSADTGEALRWDGLQGLREVSAYAGTGGKVAYFYVKALTP